MPKCIIIILLVTGLSSISMATGEDTTRSTPDPVSGRPLTVEKILPADVLSRVRLVADELNSIRFVMGAPRNAQATLQVVGAAPREVFFQALTLYRKADRFAFELTRTRDLEPIPPEDNIHPFHVWHMVDAALKRLLIVKEHLGIKIPIRERVQDITMTPTDVFILIVDVNRQLNLMLERRFSPSDVYQQVTYAVNHAAQLLSKFPGAKRLPLEPAFDPGRVPPDVYRRLLGCFDKVRHIAMQSNLSVLELRVDEIVSANATPSDVYDIASLLVSELDYLHSFTGTAPPAKAYYPGRKFPSHVYQRAGMLETQLTELERLVGTNSDWLAPKSAGVTESTAVVTRDP